MKKIIIFAAALAALVSCNKSVIVSSVEADEPGFISLGISTSDVMVETKALAANTSLAGYNITLINKTTSQTWTEEYETAVANANLWKVAPGNYTIKVENKSESEVYPDNTSAGEIRIAGQTDVTVNAGQTSICSIACSPVNAKISFNATSEFLSMFQGATVSVTGSKRTAELGSVTTSFGTEAFFNPMEVRWTLKASVFSVAQEYSGVVTLEAAKWSKVTFKTNSTNGIISLEISVNGEITDIIPLDVTIDPSTGGVTTTPGI